MPEKTIMEKLKAKSVEAQNDFANGGAIAKDLQYKALAAVLKGAHSAEWVDYMKAILGDTSSPSASAQLARLTLTDPAQNDADIRRNAAYIVANSTCGMETTADYVKNVEAVIDDGIPL
jgi:hypothetical protein